MRGCDRKWPGVAGLALIVASVAGVFLGCGGGSAQYYPDLFGTPFYTTGTTSSSSSGVSSSGRTSGSATSTTTAVAPCDETQSNKFVRISMRNISDSYIHYFLLLIAEVQSDTYPNGAVCPADQALYTAFGYTYVPEGTFKPFGSYCIVGPALYYLHKNGQFEGAGGQLASAIAPAQGSSATYDSFFGASGAQVPVPSQIIFHNPGTSAEGAALKVSTGIAAPCSVLTTVNTTACQEDAWYYVDENDQRDGTNVLGSGSYVRVPAEIQGTTCQCSLGNEAAQALAPSGTRASAAACNQFFRGGRIDYVFLRNDQEPPIPQLVWRVSDNTGSRAHDFDSRAGVP